MEWTAPGEPPPVGYFEIMDLPLEFSTDCLVELEERARGHVLTSQFIFNATEPRRTGGTDMYEDSGRRMEIVAPDELTNKLLDAVITAIDGKPPSRKDGQQSLPMGSDFLSTGPPTFLIAEDNKRCPHQWPHHDGIFKEDASVIVALSQEANFLVWVGDESIPDENGAVRRCHVRDLRLERGQFMYFSHASVHCGGTYTSFNARMYWAFTGAGSRGIKADTPLTSAVQLSSCPNPPCENCLYMSEQSESESESELESESVQSDRPGPPSKARRSRLSEDEMTEEEVADKEVEVAKSAAVDEHQEEEEEEEDTAEDDESGEAEEQTEVYDDESGEEEELATDEDDGTGDPGGETREEENQAEEIRAEGDQAGQPGEEGSQGGKARGPTGQRGPPGRGGGSGQH